MMERNRYPVSLNGLMVAIMTVLGCACAEASLDPETPLYKAAESNDLKTVKALIAGGADVNAKTHHDWTPLHMALKKGNLDMVNALIAAGADVKAKDSNGDTPLHMAVHSELELADKVIGQRGLVQSPPNYPELRKEWHLHNRAMVKALIAAGADVNVSETRYGRTPLHIAVQEYDPDTVQALIAAGADVNAKDGTRETPIFHAILVGVDMVKVLIAARADVNARCAGDTTPLHNAVRRTNPDTTKALIAAGADINAMDGSGHTPLHVAVRFNNLNEVKALISAGADVNAKKGTGETPLQLAISWGQTHTNVVEYLRKNGAKW